jgi:hypothetical protein
LDSLAIHLAVSFAAYLGLLASSMHASATPPCLKAIILGGCARSARRGATFPSEVTGPLCQCPSAEGRTRGLMVRLLYLIPELVVCTENPIRCRRGERTT